MGGCGSSGGQGGVDLRPVFCTAGPPVSRLDPQKITLPEWPANDLLMLCQRPPLTLSPSVARGLRPRKPGRSASLLTGGEASRHRPKGAIANVPLALSGP